MQCQELFEHFKEMRVTLLWNGRLTRLWGCNLM